MKHFLKSCLLIAIIIIVAIAAANTTPIRFPKGFHSSVSSEDSQTYTAAYTLNTQKPSGNSLKPSANSPKPSGNSSKPSANSSIPSSNSAVSANSSLSTQLSTSASSNSSTSSSIPERTSDSYFRVTFLDVGQGDSAFVECDGETMLIDGGAPTRSSQIYSFLRKNGFSHINYVIGTHPHEDHIGGLSGALQYASVDCVYCSTTSYDSQAFASLKNYCTKQGISILLPSSGDSFYLGSSKVTVLSRKYDQSLNNNSIILRIEFGTTSFLFMADAERELEQMLPLQDLDSTVLKVGHHGSDTSTSYQFLWNVMPEYAIISVAKNNVYGHPTDAVLSRLRDADCTVFRTDLHGDIVCTSDGESVTFVTAKKPSDPEAVFVPGSIPSVIASQQASGSSQQGNTASADSSANQSTSSSGYKEESHAEVQAAISQIPESSTPPAETSRPKTDYILNTNTGVFHYPWCSSVKQMKEKNKRYYTGYREDVIAEGYRACQRCYP